MTLKIELLQQSFTEIERHKESFAKNFYAKLFAQFPQLRAYFAGCTIETQEKKLVDTLKFVVDNFNKPETLEPACKKLGLYHENLNIRPGHYTMVGTILVASIAEFSGDNWGPELLEAWIEAYREIVRLMLS